MRSVCSWNSGYAAADTRAVSAPASRIGVTLERTMGVGMNVIRYICRYETCRACLSQRSPTNPSRHFHAGRWLSPARPVEQEQGVKWRSDQNDKIETRWRGNME